MENGDMVVRRGSEADRTVYVIVRREEEDYPDGPINYVGVDGQGNEKNLGWCYNHQWRVVGHKGIFFGRINPQDYIGGHYKNKRYDVLNPNNGYENLSLAENFQITGYDKKEKCFLCVGNFSYGSRIGKDELRLLIAHNKIIRVA
jgi:hypothetical protein